MKISRVAENLAADIVEQATGFTSVRRDDGSESGVHDFDLVQHGQSTEALEVTLATNSKLEAMHRKLSAGGGSITAPNLSRNWEVYLNDESFQINFVRSRVVPHLERLEAAGVSAVGWHLRTDDPLLRDLPIAAAFSYVREDHAISSQVFISRPPTGGTSDPMNLARAVQAEIDRKSKGSLTKAMSAGYLRRHLFIVADTTWKLDIELPLRQHEPASIPPPRLPASITDVWLGASVLREADSEFIVWRATRGRGWERVDGDWSATAEAHRPPTQ